jgi:hypothetical protein
MLEYLNLKEQILQHLKYGLTNKGHSFKELSGINGRLEIIKDIKFKYSEELLSMIIESTNYPILKDIKHGIDNVYSINKRKSDWYLYAINMDQIGEKDTVVLRDSFISSSTLIYQSEKSIGGKIKDWYIIFSRVKYDGSQEYMANKWQGR